MNTDFSRMGNEAGVSHLCFIRVYLWPIRAGNIRFRRKAEIIQS